MRMEMMKMEKKSKLQKRTQAKKAKRVNLLKDFLQANGAFQMKKLTNQLIFLHFSSLLTTLYKKDFKLLTVSYINRKIQKNSRLLKEKR